MPCDLCNKSKVFAPPHTFFHQMRGFAESFGKWSRSGFPTVSEQEFESRMAICKDCEFWDTEGFGGTGKCQKCGCSTAAKLRMATASCPIGKW